MMPKGCNIGTIECVLNIVKLLKFLFTNSFCNIIAGLHQKIIINLGNNSATSQIKKKEC